MIAATNRLEQQVAEQVGGRQVELEQINAACEYNGQSLGNEIEKLGRVLHPNTQSNEDDRHVREEGETEDDQSTTVVQNKIDVAKPEVIKDKALNAQRCSAHVPTQSLAPKQSQAVSLTSCRSAFSSFSGFTAFSVPSGSTKLSMEWRAEATSTEVSPSLSTGISTALLRDEGICLWSKEFEVYLSEVNKHLVDPKKSNNSLSFTSGNEKYTPKKDAEAGSKVPVHGRPPLPLDVRHVDSAEVDEVHHPQRAQAPENNVMFEAPGNELRSSAQTNEILSLQDLQISREAFQPDEKPSFLSHGQMSETLAGFGMRPGRELGERPKEDRKRTLVLEDLELNSTSSCDSSVMDEHSLPPLWESHEQAMDSLEVLHDSTHRSTAEQFNDGRRRDVQQLVKKEKHGSTEKDVEATLREAEAIKGKLELVLKENEHLLARSFQLDQKDKELRQLELELNRKNRDVSMAHVIEQELGKLSALKAEIEAEKIALERDSFQFNRTRGRVEDLEKLNLELGQEKEQLLNKIRNLESVKLESEILSKKEAEVREDLQLLLQQKTALRKVSVKNRQQLDDALQLKDRCRVILETYSKELKLTLKAKEEAAQILSNMEKVEKDLIARELAVQNKERAEAKLLATIEAKEREVAQLKAREVQEEELTSKIMVLRQENQMLQQRLEAVVSDSQQVDALLENVEQEKVAVFSLAEEVRQREYEVGIEEAEVRHAKEMTRVERERLESAKMEQDQAASEAIEELTAENDFLRAQLETMGAEGRRQLKKAQGMEVINGELRMQLSSREKHVHLLEKRLSLAEEELRETSALTEHHNASTQTDSSLCGVSEGEKQVLLTKIEVLNTARLQEAKKLEQLEKEAVSANNTKEQVEQQFENNRKLLKKQQLIIEKYRLWQRRSESVEQREQKNAALEKRLERLLACTRQKLKTLECSKKDYREQMKLNLETKASDNKDIQQRLGFIESSLKQEIRGLKHDLRAKTKKVENLKAKAAAARKQAEADKVSAGSTQLEVSKHAQALVAEVSQRDQVIASLRNDVFCLEREKASAMLKNIELMERIKIVESRIRRNDTKLKRSRSKDGVKRKPEGPVKVVDESGESASSQQKVVFYKEGRAKALQAVTRTSGAVPDDIRGSDQQHIVLKIGKKQAGLVSENRNLRAHVIDEEGETVGQPQFGCTALKETGIQREAVLKSAEPPARIEKEAQHFVPPTSMSPQTTPALIITDHRTDAAKISPVRQAPCRRTYGSPLNVNDFAGVVDRAKERREALAEKIVAKERQEQLDTTPDEEPALLNDRTSEEAASLRVQPLSAEVTPQASSKEVKFEAEETRKKKAVEAKKKQLQTFNSSVSLLKNEVSELQGLKTSVTKRVERLKALAPENKRDGKTNKFSLSHELYTKLTLFSDLICRAVFKLENLESLLKRGSAELATDTETSCGVLGTASLQDVNYLRHQLASLETSVKDARRTYVEVEEEFRVAMNNVHTNMLDDQFLQTNLHQSLAEQQRQAKASLEAGQESVNVEGVSSLSVLHSKALSHEQPHPVQCIEDMSISAMQDDVASSMRNFEHLIQKRERLVDKLDAQILDSSNTTLSHHSASEEPNTDSLLDSLPLSPQVEHDGDPRNIQDLVSIDFRTTKHEPGQEHESMTTANDNEVNNAKDEEDHGENLVRPKVLSPLISEYQTKQLLSPSEALVAGRTITPEPVHTKEERIIVLRNKLTLTLQQLSVDMALAETAEEEAVLQRKVEELRVDLAKLDDYS